MYTSLVESCDDLQKLYLPMPRKLHHVGDHVGVDDKADIHSIDVEGVPTNIVSSVLVLFWVLLFVKC